jgi:hypothetical protein
MVSPPITLAGPATASWTSASISLMT